MENFPLQNNNYTNINPKMLTLSTFQVAVLYVFYNHGSYFRAILDVLLKCIGVSTYLISGDKMSIVRCLNNLQKHKALITGKAYSRGKMYPSGFFIATNYIGFITAHPHFIQDYEIMILTTEKVFHELTDEDTADFLVEDDDSSEDTKTEEPAVPPSIISVCTRHGTYTDFYYNSHKLNVTGLQPKGNQEAIMNSILAHYRKFKRGTFFIQGPPATGKSSIGYLLAKELKAPFSHQLDPTLPGDSIYRWIQNMDLEDGQNTPCILVIEEADTMIRKIHNGNVEKNANIPTDVHDKTTWSNFLDDMVFYNNVILILTSNTPKKQLDALDPSYLRKGRISMVLEMTQSVLEDESSTSPPSPSAASVQESLQQPRAPSPALSSAA